MKWYGEIDEVKLGIEVFDIKGNLSEVYVSRCEEGYSFEKKDAAYYISYADKASFFRAVSLLNYCIVNNVDLSRSETPRFNSCGIMVDVSRNAVLTVESVKKIIRYMASMGLNQLMLYTEDTYEVEGYPYFGYMRGAYTKSEIKEIVAYAEIFGIETIPCIQTLAHLEKALRWSCTAEIQDTPDILLIDEEKTYEFIEALIKTTRETYNTDKIHIGMDEAHYMGLGNYRTKHGYPDRLEIFSRHLKRVTEITKKYGFKEPMIWSDMFFCVAMGGYYVTEDKDNKIEDIKNAVPDDVNLVYWNYYSEEQPPYDIGIEMHQYVDKDTIFAGGIWTWGGPSVNYDKTKVTTDAALKSCIEHGVKDVFATMWGDDGAECSVFEALYGMQMYAEYNYSENPTDTIDQMFKICTGYDPESFMLFSVDTFEDYEKNPSHSATIAKQALYQDLLMGTFEKNFEQLDLKKHYKYYMDKLNELAPQGDMEYLFEYHRQLVKVLYEKCDMGKRLIDAYKSDNKQKLAELIDEIDILYNDFKLLHKLWAEVWYKNNKPFGFELLDARLGGTETRIERAKLRVEEYLNENISEIPELAQERLWFAGEDKPCLEMHLHARIFI